MSMGFVATRPTVRDKTPEISCGNINTSIQHKSKHFKNVSPLQRAGVKNENVTTQGEVKKETRKGGGGGLMPSSLYFDES